MPNSKTTILAVASAIVLVAVVLVGAISVGPDSGSKRPRRLAGGTCRDCNVIIILMDALRPDHLGCYGYAKNTSPNIDAFAATALRFDKVFATASWTKPAVVSMLTGRYPGRFLLARTTDSIPDGTITLQGILAEEGYSTAAFVASRMLNMDWRIGRTFGRFCCGQNDFGQKPGGSLLKPGSDIITDEVAKHLEWSKGRKSFVYVHFMDTHTPYHAPPGASRLAEAQADEDNSRLKRRDLQSYDEAIRFNDAQIGRLFGAIRENEKWDDSIIILTADHGEAFGEHGNHGHFNSLYDEEIRIPFIMKLPGARPRVVGGLYSQVDIMPTLLSALGIPSPRGIDGIDMLSGTREIVVSENNKLSIMTSARTLDRKVVFQSTDSSFSCFDLAIDPTEHTNISGGSDSRCRKLESTVRSFLSSGSVVGPGKMAFSEGDLAQLKALGYTD